MPASPAPVTLRRADLTPKIAADRRRHKRVNLTLIGRFMRANKEEFPCTLLDVSVGGAAVTAPVAVELDERIIAYFDHLGGLEGTVVRLFDGGFGFKLNATRHKREKLAAQITWLINKSELDPTDHRRIGHERLQAAGKTMQLKLAEDITVSVDVLDISISGASVSTPARPPLGTEVVLGRLRARVVRHHVRGIGLQFVDIQNPDALRRYFG